MHREMKEEQFTRVVSWISWPNLGDQWMTDVRRWPIASPPEGDKNLWCEFQGMQDFCMRMKRNDVESVGHWVNIHTTVQLYPSERVVMWQELHVNSRRRLGRVP